MMPVTRIYSDSDSPPEARAALGSDSAEIVPRGLGSSLAVRRSQAGTLSQVTD